MTGRDVVLVTKGRDVVLATKWVTKARVAKTG